MVHILSHLLKQLSRFLRHTRDWEPELFLCACISGRHRGPAVKTTLQNLWLMGGGAIEFVCPTDLSIEAWYDRVDSCRFCAECRGTSQQCNRNCIAYYNYAYDCWRSFLNPSRDDKHHFVPPFNTFNTTLDNYERRMDWCRHDPEYYFKHEILEGIRNQNFHTRINKEEP